MWQIHDVRAPEQPVHASLKAVCDLRRPPDAGAKPVRCHAASPAGMREPFVEEAEIGLQGLAVRRYAQPGRWPFSNAVALQRGG